MTYNLEEKLDDHFDYMNVRFENLEYMLDLILELLKSDDKVTRKEILDEWEEIRAVSGVAPVKEDNKDG